MFQETHSSLDSNIEWRRSLSEWELEFSNGKTNSKGVCTAFKKTLEIKLIKNIADTKGQFLITECIIGETKLFLINIYAPSTSLEKEYLAFLSSMKQKLEDVYDKTSPILMGGDFNYIIDYNIDRKGGSVKKWPKCNEVFKSMTDVYELIDIWRVRNPTKKRFTWRRKNPTPIQSRLDYWLISDSVQSSVHDCCIMPGIHSDHSAVKISLINQEPVKGPSLWKFNNLLLDDTEYVAYIKNVIATEIRSMEETEMSAQAKWEFLKFKIKQFTRKYSIQKSKNRKKERKDLEAEINRLEELLADTNSGSDYDKLTNCKKRLDDILDLEIKSLIFQSKTTIYEQDEKNTKYFLNLIKYRKGKSSIKAIKCMNKPNVILKGQQEITKTIKKFYEKLYTEVPRENNAEHIGFFLDSLPKISGVEQRILDREISENEVFITLKTFSKGKSPGNDGLSSEFYMKFWSDIKHCLMGCLRANIGDGIMTTSQRQSVISLLEKEGKDKLLLKNWRPISLINTDTKLFSKVLALRLRKVINKVVNPEQVAYVNDRFIGDGIRLIYDILEVSRNRNGEGYLAAVDFEKAFDSINLDYMYDTLKTYGIPDRFIAYIKTLYSGIESCVINNGTTTSYFPIQRGVRQGDPLSPYLFILCLEPLAAAIRNNSDIKGIELGNGVEKISLYADDITLFLKDLSSVKEVMNIFKKFQNISGLKCNSDKTELMPLGRCEIPHETLGLLWKEEKIKILGILFNKNDIVDKETYSSVVNKLKSRLKMWEMRGLSLIGKIQIIKTYGISQILYVTNMVGASDKFVHEVNKLIYNFLWKGQDKVKRNVMIADYKDGGLKMIDISCTMRAQQIMWMRRFLLNYEHPWKKYLRGMINPLGGDCILFGSVQISNTMLPYFYVNCINLVNRYIDGNMEDFPHTIYHQSLWHNESIKVKKKGLFCKELNQLGIRQVKDIFNAQGVIKTWNEIQGASNALFLQWYGCINAVCKAGMKKCPDIDRLCNNDKIIEKLCAVKHRTIYNYFIESVSERPSNEIKLIEKYNFECMESVYTLPFKVCINSKSRAFQFRCIKNIIFLNERLFKMKLIDDDMCSLCNCEKETPSHFFVYCNVAKELWSKLLNVYTVFNEHNIVELSEENILYGVHINEVDCPKIKLMNHLIILCKKYLYNCRMYNSKPHINGFISNVLLTRNIEFCIAQNKRKLYLHNQKWYI